MNACFRARPSTNASLSAVDQSSKSVEGMVHRMANRYAVLRPIVFLFLLGEILETLVMMYQVVYRDVLTEIQQTVMLKLLPSVFSSVALVVVAQYDCNATCFAEAYSKGRFGSGDIHGELTHGTGFVIDNGLLAINYHILQSRLSSIDPDATSNEGAKPCVAVLLPDYDRFLPCRILDVQPCFDLAIIELLDQDVNIPPPLEFSYENEAAAPKMQTLLVPGNGLSKSSIVAIRGTRDDVEIVYSDHYRVNLTGLAMYQTELVIDPLTSGSPLLNSQGQVVGMTSLLARPSDRSAGVSFAIPSQILYPEIIRILGKDDHKLIRMN